MNEALNSNRLNRPKLKWPRFIAAVLALGMVEQARADGDPMRGAKVFQACAVCHSLEPGRHLTGPSLGQLLGRKAGTAPGFHRYSDALKRSGIVWNESTLDRWFADPQAIVPGTLMVYQGLAEPQARADLLAFLRAAAHGKAPPAAQVSKHPDLKSAPPAARVTALRHCGDTYFLTDASGRTRSFWEFNLRFKTDSSQSGPAAGKPVTVSQGMQGDRAQVVFSHPGEISRFIEEKC